MDTHTYHVASAHDAFAAAGLCPAAAGRSVGLAVLLAFAAAVLPAQEAARQPAAAGPLAFLDGLGFPLAGSWKYVVEYTCHAVPSEVLREAAAKMTEELRSLPAPAVPGYLRLRDEYQAMSAEPEQPRTHAVENVDLRVVDAKNFFWSKTGQPVNAADQEYCWQLLSTEDWYASRQDNRTPEGNSISQQFVLMPTKYDVIAHAEELPLLASENLAVLQHALRLGTNGATGRRIIDREQFTSHLPTTFDCPLNAVSETLTVEADGKDAIRVLAVMFDQGGCPTKRWASRWKAGELRELTVTTFVWGTSHPRWTDRIRIVESGPAPAKLPTVQEMSVSPTAMDSAIDCRSGREVVFDPRLGAKELAPEPVGAGPADALGSAPSSVVVAAPAAMPMRRPTELVVRQDDSGALPTWAWGALVGLGIALGVALGRRASSVASLLVCALLATACSGEPAPVAVVLATDAGAAQGGAEFVPPALECRLNPGEFQRRQMHLVNNTGSNMKLLSVQGSCGCVTVECATSSLAPYAAVPLDLLLEGQGNGIFAVKVHYQLEGAGDQPLEMAAPLTMHVEGSGRHGG